MAEQLRYVNTDSTPGGDGTTNNATGTTRAYASLTEWEANEQQDLVSAGDTARVLSDAPSGTADTTQLSIIGWTTGVADYIQIQANTGNEAIKTSFDSARYRLERTDGQAISLQEEYVRFVGLQIKVIATSTTSDCLFTSTIGASNDIRFFSCRLESSGGSAAFGIRSTTININLTIENTIFNTFTNDALRINCNTLNIYSSVIYGSSTAGLEIDSGAVTATDLAVFNNSDDFQLDGGTTTIDYCASDDGDGTNAVAPSGSDWDNEFVDPANGDFTPLNSGNIFHAGIAISGLTIDMSGNSWDDPPTLGANEFVGGGTVFNVTCSDTMVTSDTINTQAIISAVLTDGMALTDTTPSNVNFNPIGSDSAAFNDAVTALANISATLSELAIFADTATPESAPIELICNDSITLSDVSTGKIDFNVTCPDGIALTDFSQAVAIIAGSALDGITLTDIALETSQLPQGLVTITATSAKLNITFNIVSKLKITGGN